ncbi:MAG: cytochrome-c peroxidase [Verrucomicrobia bacterium 12-59-8]|nr:MAG: cytochrome-c peroxidase [Verrucomicrobia bacterium 12-59-8]
MKPASLLLFCSVAAFSLSSPSQAQLPDGSAIQLTRNTAGNSVQVMVTDPGDHVWVLQSSSNLATWSDVVTLKVHNGYLTRSMSLQPADKQLFYRTSYSASQQSLLSSSVATGLLLPASPDNYANPTLPASFFVNPILAQDNTPANNATSDLGAKLGRVLFYDKRLSFNQTIACASCHLQQHGFADSRAFSTGFAGGLTGRNSMGLANARWYQRRSFFWDERAATLEDQVLMPIQNAVEMGMTLPALVTRLGAEPFYTELFNATFGTPEVTSGRISQALAQFVRSIISTQTKYDLGVAATPQFSNFTAQENQGRQIFNAPGGCSACHGTDNFVPGGGPANNNGLEFPYVDTGIGGITGQQGDMGKFKVGSLRNIELTAPYMHDGRFATLEAVVDFYSTGVVDNPNLSPPLRLNPQQGGGVRRPNFTTAEKAALVAFLKTLTDTSLPTATKFSDPFNYGN